MRCARIVLVMAAGLVALFTPAVAMAALPPGNSGLNQYTETYPAAGGESPTTNKGAGNESGGKPNAGGAGETPSQALGRHNAEVLEQQGSAGRAAAAAAAATAPLRVTDSGKSDLNRDPRGESRLHQVISQVGGSSSGGMGLLLPLMIAAAGLGSVVYAWRRSHQQSASS